MNDLSRRTMLKAGAATLIAAGLPTPSPAVVPHALPALPVWTVGTYGEMDWQIIAAATEQDAVREWLAISGNTDPDEAITVRQPEMDGKSQAEQERIWFGQGTTLYCRVCGYEASVDEDGVATAEAIYCGDCAVKNGLIAFCDDEAREAANGN